ncbi:MAG: hypothetical protein ACM3WP_11010 [Acidobacteriota bacterium]
MPSVTTTVDFGGSSSRALDADDQAAELRLKLSVPQPVVAAERGSFFPFTVVLLLIVVGLVFALARGRVADPDIWWHLHNAKYLVQNHALPRYDMYSFTVAGHPWINHEWLAEIPFYCAWRLLGLSGIDALTITLLSLIYLGVLYLAWKESGNFKAATIATVCAIFLGRSSFGPRTILCGYACLVLLLIILQRVRQRKFAALWLIPPLFCLWINAHGSWSLGMIVFSVVIGGRFLDVRCRLIQDEPWAGNEKKRLLWTWAVSVAFLFINPYGWRLVFYPLDLAFRQETNIEHVTEWVSLNFHDPRGKFVLLLLIVTVFSAQLRSRRWSWTDLALVSFGVYSGLTYVRFLCLMGVLLAPALAKMVDFVPPYRADLDTPIINVLAALLVVAGIVHYWPKQSNLASTVQDQYPAGAVSYLKTHPVNGPTLNYYLWGGYLNWQEPSTKVFIDGRADIFDYSGVFREYLDVIGIHRPDAILEKYKIRYVLFPHNEPFTYVLEHNAGWRTVYSDGNSVLFERADSEAAK